MTAPELADFAASILDDYKVRVGGQPAVAIVDFLRVIAARLYWDEGAYRFSHIPSASDPILLARHRDELRHIKEVLSNAGALAAFRGAIVQSFVNLTDELPRAAFYPIDQSMFSLRLLEMLPNIGEVIERITAPYFDAATPYHLFSSLRWRLLTNQYEASNLIYSPVAKGKPGKPSQYKGTPEETISAFLRGTPFEKIFFEKVPFALPPEIRFSHHWIIAPPGTGKSTCLQNLILQDLPLVVDDEASLIIMESNRDLIKAVEGLQLFAPGGQLYGKLVLIDVEDVEFPIALNLFDIGTDRLADYSPRDREALYTSVLSLYDYIFSSLLGAELTSRQNTLFTFTIQLLLEIPGATLDTLIDLMQKNGTAPYQQYIDGLDPDARRFFEMKFHGKDFERTKDQVVDRLFAVKRNRTLARMFSAPRSKLDLYEEMGAGKVILINAAKSLLQEEGVEIFGRFFIAMILLAAQKRQLLAREQRLPCFIYIDEAQDVIARDSKIPVILDQARKLNCALILAHQRLNQMSPPVLDALYGATAIKFAAQVSDANAHALARNMGCTPEFILKQPQYHFAASVRGLTDTAVSLAIPDCDLNRMDRMSDHERVALRDQMRDRYAHELVYTPPRREPVEEFIAEPVDEEHPEPMVIVVVAEAAASPEPALPEIPTDDASGEWSA